MNDDEYECELCHQMVHELTLTKFWKQWLCPECVDIEPDDYRVDDIDSLGLRGLLRSL